MFGKLILLICLIGFVFCQQPITQFSAKGTITNDPKLSPGSGLTINLYYDSLNQLIRWEYPNLKNPANNGPVYEIRNYTSGTESQLCGSCSAFKLVTSLPIFYQEKTDTPASNQQTVTNDQNRKCSAFQKAVPANSGQIQYIWVTSNGIPCQAVAVDGTTYTFTNVRPGAPASSVFNIPPNSNCPAQPVCQAPIDLVLVLDQSGSINTTEWGLLTAFSDAVVDSFIIGPTQTQIGVVYFSGLDYKPGQDPSSCCGLSDPALPLSFDRSTIKKILNNHLQTGGHTCINCGIKSATTYEPNPNRAVQVPKVMLVLTDGFNNRQTLFFPIDVQNAKSQGWDMFAVGVKVRNDQELESIASSPISSHLLYVGDFFGLRSTVKYLTSAICSDFPKETTCGPSCKGKCICGGQCLCPDICVPPNKCSTAKNVVVNGTCVGCFSTPKTCAPDSKSSKCFKTTCDPDTGNCKDEKTVCTPPNPCLTGTCKENVGCVYTSKCSAQIFVPGTNIPNLCLQGICNNVTGTCGTTPVTCPAPNACFNSTCDPYLGCVSTPRNCDDNNACTIDTCSNSTGCSYTSVDCLAALKNSPDYKANPSAYNCAVATCDPKVGCITTKKTCDDGNLCTTDSCDSKGNCVNAQITCTQDPNDKCNKIICDSQAGCVKQPAVICDDNKACTNDSCDPATGQCSFIPIVCPAAPNGCTTSVCDETAKQCILKPSVVCTNQVSDKCTTFACDPTTKQCKSTTTVCNPPDLCSTSVCDPKAGCVATPKVCNDGNTCTLDVCNATTGNCDFTPIPGCKPKNCVGCTSTDPCNPKVCLNGTCVVTPVVCPSDKCVTLTPVASNGKCQCTATASLTCPPIASGQCGENICDPATGQCVLKGGRVCDDNNPCTTDTCAIVNGAPQCTFTAVPCSGDSPCSKKICVNKNGVGVCVDNPGANAFNCTSGSQCATAQCNPITGQCEYNQVNCSDSNSGTCNRLVCDPVARKCVQSSGLSCTASDPLGCGISGTCVVINGTDTCSYQPTCPTNDVCKIANCTPTATAGGKGTCTTTTINCNDENPCTVSDRCITSVNKDGNAVPKCDYDPFVCPVSSDPCTINKCVNQNGKAVCVPTTVTCAPPNKCSTGKCIVKNGLPVCQYDQINCGTNDICYTYNCDPVKGCNVTNKCDDHNNCTNDICDPKTGKCSYTPVVCNSTDLCKNSTCDPVLGCVSNPINCSSLANVTGLITPCSYPICAPNNGCQIAIVPNTIDACGYCLKPGLCGANRDTGVSPGAVAGAVIGGAVVAGVAAAGIGAFAASSTSTGFAPATDNAIVGANTNPLYAQPNTAGNNPFHNDNYVQMNN